MTSQQQTFGKYTEGGGSGPELRDVTTHIVDSEHKSAPESEEGYPLIKTSDLENGRIDFQNIARVDEDAYQEWTSRLTPRPGDIIFTREAPVGRVGIVPENREVCLGQRTVLIRADSDKIDEQYLRYLLLSEDVQNRLHSLSTGSTVDHLNLEDLRSFELPELPSLEYQKKIGDSLSDFDQKIRVNDQINQVAQDISQLLFKDGFASKKTGSGQNQIREDTLPDGWESGKLGDLMVKITDRIDPTEKPNSTPYLSLKHMAKGSISIDEWGEAEESKSTKYEFQEGQILFGRLRPYFCKVGIAPTDGVCSTDIQVIEPKKGDYWREFLLCQLTTQRFIDYCDRVSTGTRMPRVGWNDMCDYTVPIPPESRVKEFSMKVKPFVDQIINNIHESRSLQKSREVLLEGLITGDTTLDEPDKQICEMNKR
ncbi:restriction endonuclease subunit S [Haloferax volcanii]|uniref:Restriction modification system DNA specificity domain-containing protein n=2 Tax=Haloferax volcanii TaxID=2246 RepID=M0HWR8_HALVO|nr:restriction endonuclease subunit S [Haloferax alexandrinus]ELZ88147.1 restriction modification system DNA specificity domain-containing protein [Haloferax alexandrinus JCM 10717]NLV03869.1 restriction endonuclease subunit S [Haloferax alexandrinus]